ncbi:MAG: homocysteine S-methyltransferase family protein [Candidatus Eisenbacteria bacterium]|nr:homocysteine S-methyltransferase family protein [Candidatus Eisenbacteria bacterium]
MSPFLDRLARGPCLLLDGGLGSELIARGLPPGAPPDLWTLERPEEILAVHRAYVESGSDVVHANTFGANAARLACFGLLERRAEVNRAAVRLARESGASLVVADIGPTGEYLPPVGHGDPARWRAHFLEQARILSDAGVDAFHVETMSDLREALVALEALREAAPGVPAMVSLTFDRKKRGFFTLMGDAAVASLARLREAGADAVGANCTLASGDMRDLALEAAAAGLAPLVFQPNAGQPERLAHGVRYAQEPDRFAAEMAPLAGVAGVAALGGCCGTDPRFIAALRARLDVIAAGPASPGRAGSVEGTA